MKQWTLSLPAEQAGGGTLSEVEVSKCRNVNGDILTPHFNKLITLKELKTMPA
jgi:hypothetical protein